MPTFERLPRFARDCEALSPAEKAGFKHAVKKFVEDLEVGRGFRKDVRVQGVQGGRGIFELTWADDGRATFEYGDSLAGDAGEPHVVWRRVGTHEVFGNP